MPFGTHRIGERLIFLLRFEREVLVKFSSIRWKAYEDDNLTLPRSFPYWFGVRW